MLVADELGHIKLMNELHGKLQERISVAEEAAAGLAATRAEAVKIPVLLTEGKTDVLILEEAWRKLRGTARPFAIKSCNVLSETEKNDAAGAAQLAICLRSIMADNHSVVIGLFDRDDEGKKCWALDANFAKQNLFSDVKASKNGKADAILLPVPDGEPDLANSSHHCLEFMFPTAALNAKKDGRGLILKGFPLVTKCGSKVVSSVEGTEIWQMTVADGKKIFAEEIVPTLDVSYFKEFEILALVEGIIAAIPVQQPDDSAVTREDETEPVAEGIFA
ncbi:hypothetical protein ACL2DZ_17395 [Sinorhizobium meliloti]